MIYTDRKRVFPNSVFVCAVRGIICHRWFIQHQVWVSYEFQEVERVPEPVSNETKLV